MHLNKFYLTSLLQILPKFIIKGKLDINFVIDIRELASQFIYG